MNSTEFKKHLFLANKDGLLAKAFYNNYFTVCPINKLLGMCKEEYDSLEISDSSEYLKLKAAHVVYFTAMDEVLINELKRCCESVCWMIEQTFEANERVKSSVVATRSICNLWGLIK